MEEQRLSDYKKKYPFLEKILENGYGKGQDLFQVEEEDISERIRDCFIHGACNSGAEFTSWDWGGIKDHQIIDLSRYSTIKESLAGKILDYVFCDEILTIEHNDHDYTDRSIAIYKI